MATIPASMWREASLEQALLDSIRVAGDAFTRAQVDRMSRANVRFWHHQGIPPQYEGRFELRSDAGLYRLKKAQYLPAIKTIRLLRGAGPAHVIHEMAHAWDHIRDNRMEASPVMRRMFGLYRGRVLNDDRLPFYSVYPRYSLASPLEFYAEGYTVFHHPAPNEQQQLRLLRFAPELYDLLERESRGLSVPIRRHLETLNLS